MRKYCRACGASLIQKEEPQTPEPVEEPVEEPIAGAPSLSEDEPLVRPSEVASEQVEMKDDEPEPEEAAVPESGVTDHERGKEVVADILEKVRAAEARTRAEEDTAPSETDLEPPPVEPLEELDEPLAYEEPEAEIAVEEPMVAEPEPPPPDVIEFEEPSEVAEPTASAETAEVSSQAVETTDMPDRDEKVRKLELDISSHNIELAQLQSELDTLGARLDEEVERYLVAAETKRSRTESLERELDLAKKEFNDANKEYKNAENRRKKELSNAEKRIRDVEKRIEKAEDAKEKRIRDLEKERLKREEEAKKD